MRYLKGDIFLCDAEALVNTVNTVGVMGKGIALQFKERFPLNFNIYRDACKKGEVRIGKMLITGTGQQENPKWIINFPTKAHWKNKSDYAFIEAGLDDLIQQIQNLRIQSIAIPPLGAGQGGLDWKKVRQIIEQKLSSLEIDVMVFEPASNSASQSLTGTTKLTKSRAMILYLIAQYKKLGYASSLLEIQKLAYFLQRMGQADLRLNYKQYLYGPYAHNLQHVLHELEKGYLTGERTVMDSGPGEIFNLLFEKTNEVNSWVEKHCSESEKGRLQKVIHLLQGYESPFGLELLSTVDWILNENDYSLTDEAIQEKIAKWSRRKSDNFFPHHVTAAHRRLCTFREEFVN